MTDDDQQRRKTSTGLDYITHYKQEMSKAHSEHGRVPLNNTSLVHDIS
jgi:hypothetical protein